VRNEGPSKPIRIPTSWKCSSSHSSPAMNLPLSISKQSLYNNCVHFIDATRRNCEFLEKLDMTLNFVDVDTLQDGVRHLQPLQHLVDATFMGNPFTDWKGHR